jgi:hypothetical protein
VTDHTGLDDGMPFFEAEPVNALLHELGLNWVDINHPELDLVIGGALSAFESRLDVRASVLSSPAFATLYTYIGQSSTSGSASTSTTSLGAGNVVGGGGSGTSASGVDSMRTKIHLLSLMKGKWDWISASRLSSLSQESLSQRKFISGTESFDTVAALVTSTLQASTSGSSSILGAGFGSSASIVSSGNSQGFIQSFYEMTTSAFAVPPVHLNAVS